MTNITNTGGKGITSGEPTTDGHGARLAVNDRRQGDLFLTAVQLTRMAMVVSDPNQPDNPIVFCNAAFCEQTGYPEEEVIGRNCRFLQGAATDRATVQRIATALAATKPIEEDIYNYRRDGRGFWNALFISPIHDVNGKLIFFFASQVDVTRRKEAQQQQQQRLSNVGSMASGVAHAFNNLMTIVVASIGQAAANPSSERQGLQLARADEAARTAGRLTQQMLSFAQRQFLEESAVDLTSLVRNLDSVLAGMAGERCQLVLDLAVGPVPAWLDAGQLELALVALMRNAVEAMPEGGQITITTREYRSWDIAEGQTGRSWVELTVTDRGEGMPSDIAGRATEPFFTTRPNGAGLGLSMVQGFVEQSRGRLRIETEPTQGTTVRLIFPKHGDV